MRARAPLHMIKFLSAEWRELLEQNGLGNFEALWNLDADWFEEPNRCRGGWSGVCRIELKRPDGGVCAAFLKRQHNHTRSTLHHALKGEPTLQAEVRNIQRLAAQGIPTLELLCHGQQACANGRNALLLTKELTGYQPLSDLISPERIQQLGIARRRAIARAVADMVHKLHLSHLVHNCLYPKHVFVRLQDERIDVRLIDVEKARIRRSAWRRTLRDLDSLNRRAPNVSRTDRLSFLLAYLQQSKLDRQAKKLWRRLAGRMNKGK